VSEKSQLILMAEYNQLMNQRILQASKKLPNNVLVADKGAFFKSIVGTLNHIMVGDIWWLKRFSNLPYLSLQPIRELEKPKRLDEILYGDLDVFGKERAVLDVIIISWCNEVNEEDLGCPLKYYNSKGEEHSKRLADLILHLFLHQIHHRGQITALLSQEKIEFGETDLPEIIPDMM